MPVKKKPQKCMLVQTEECSWYVIPVAKLAMWREWEDKSRADPYAEGSDEPPKWAKYVQDPGHVEFYNWRSTL